MARLLRWLDDNLLPILAGFLLIFIPLYPKLPLFDVLPGYIVRVRFEDFLVFFTILIWLLWIIRGKTKLTENPLIKPIAAYLLVGLLSMVSAVFIVQTVPNELLHIQKMVLHFLRRIEYFSLFFIFYSSIKTLRQVKIYMGLLIATIIGVAIYGFGQKYLYWPAFSTMNREFSKGWMLYLTAHARVLSTFGGHYDLAAFTMMALVFLWSLFFGLKNWFWKVGIFIVLSAAFWTLILTASRTSFIAYLIGLSIMFFFYAYKKGLKWTISRWLAVTLVSIIVMLSFGDLSERFTKLLKIDERISGLKFLLLTPIGKPPDDKAIFLANNPDELSAITSSSDQPPTTRRPSDVETDIPLVIPVGTDGATITKQRSYSRTAFTYDLSTAIRFDALWPMAISGFKRNILLGSGYSTLNKTQTSQFTEAESTDNDYLRSLGETGLLGFITFFGTLFIILYLVWRNLSIIRDPVIFSLAAGFSGLLVGLLVNAVYIDVFESSKVAFSFWAITGITLAGVNIAKRNRGTTYPSPTIPHLNDFKKSLKTKVTNFVGSDLFYLLLILFVGFILRLYKINTPLADWHSWRQSDTSAVTRNYVKHGINILYPTYYDLSNVASGVDNPKGLRMVEFPLYNVASVLVDKIFVGYSIEISGRLTSIFAALGSIIFLFKLVKKYLGKLEAIFASSLYAILPYNIFFTRVVLPEPFLVFTTFGMIYFFDKWVEKLSELRTKNPIRQAQGKQELRTYAKIFFYFFFALVFTSSSLLIKPFAIFLIVPMAYLWFRNLGINFKSIIGLLGYWVIGLLPFIWWRWWISHFPEGIPAYTWLLNGDGIRFKGAFFYWIFAERIAKLILGYWGLPLLVFGIIAKAKKEGLLFYFWGLGILLYLFVFATGNVRHDYYQILTIPIIVIFMAKGIVFVANLSKENVSRWAVYGSLFVLLLLSEMFGWYQIRDFYNVNHPEIVEAGSAVERKTNESALVIAPYNGDTAFLYQTRRSGWPIVQDDIEILIKKGADYYVSVAFDDLTRNLIVQATSEDPLIQKYKLIELTPQYVIIQLVPDRELPR